MQGRKQDGPGRDQTKHRLVKECDTHRAIDDWLFVLPEILRHQRAKGVRVTAHGWNTVRLATGVGGKRPNDECRRTAGRAFC